ncbi:hypothetical protein K2173_011236 [Erythroxylum novogranatense]|uniref:RING-type E3 ubiquitin transferase n=1 Tax=Erythroxylum novogranatense TaxID=1862640 RepID=A0AAV8TT51_9ROSI|nr:hypothetical protein K2173_011236 [Erythroxylum novogranatense]
MFLTFSLLFLYLSPSSSPIKIQENPTTTQCSYINIRNKEKETVKGLEEEVWKNQWQQGIGVTGSYESSNGQNQNQNPIGSLGGYFVGPGLDLLLQHLAENDSNRYGTPPAHKEAIDALPTVTIKEKLQCSVCLDEYGIGTEAKEMPCKHKFHKECILPWLELHSSCPVCRYQLSVDESKLDSERPRNINTQTLNDGGETNINHGSTFEEGDGEGEMEVEKIFLSLAFQ